VLLLLLAAVRPTVIHAHNPRTFNLDSNDNRNDAERDFSDLSSGSVMRLGEGASHLDAESLAVGGKHAATDATVGSPHAQALNDAHAEREDGRNLSGDVERIARQEIDGGVAEGSAPVVPLPEDKMLSGQAQDRNPQTQAGRGDFVDEMSSAGYTNLSVDELIRLKTAGVTAAYVRSLRALGFTSLTPKELYTLSIHGVTPSYVESLRAAGYNALSAKELTAFRIHGVTPEYIKTLRDAGYANLAAKQLVEFRIHGVTPAFISEIRAAGSGNLSPKELVSFRIYGITPEFIRTARGRLGELSIKQLITLKNMGILDDEKGKEKDKR
jgi:hypothetical protein